MAEEGDEIFGNHGTHDDMGALMMEVGDSGRALGELRSLEGGACLDLEACDVCCDGVVGDGQAFFGDVKAAKQAAAVAKQDG